jgi:dihydroflavonol-4-reductase
MRVLVTGATGFLGRWVARALQGAGHEVLALSRGRSGPSPSSTAARLLHVQGDVLSLPDMQSAMAGAEAVVHCAGSVSLKRRDRQALAAVNVTGTSNVLSAAAARGLRVLFTSSTACIGPTRAPLVLDESAPASKLDFDSPYVESKRRAEAIALSHARDGQDVVVLNPGVTLGPDDDGATSTQLVLGYLTGQLRLHLPGGAAFCDVRDVAAAYAAALARGRKGERYVLAGANLSHAQLQAELCELTDLQRSQPLPRALASWLALWSEASAQLVAHPFEQFNSAVVSWGSLFNYCSSAKAERELGYRPRPFQETLAATIGSHLERGAAPASTAKLRQLLARARAEKQAG